MKLGKKLKASHQFFHDSFNRYWFFYAVDWGFCIVLYLIGGAVIGFIPPVERYFLLGQPELSYPHIPTDSVQFQYLMIILACLSFGTFALFGYITRSFQDFHMASLGCIQGFSLVIFMTCTTKIFAGRLRPDWYSRCQPYEEGGVLKCAGDPFVVQQGRQSFFSGHTSIAFVFATHLSLYLIGKLRPNNHHGHFYKVVICMFPMIFAAWVAVTRTTDYRHHWDDVLVGALVGTAIGAIFYFQHYPNPFTSSNEYDLPYRYHDKLHKRRKPKESIAEHATYAEMRQIGVLPEVPEVSH